MKYSIITAFTALLLVFACDEKYEPRNYDDYFNSTPIVSAFFAGDKDSCIYYDYEPDIELSTKYLTNGYFDYTQPFDIDGDGINDFAININGYKDTSKKASNYWRTINLQSLTGYRVSHGYVLYYYDSIGYGGWVTDFNLGVRAVPYGDTLTNNYFDYYQSSDKIQMIESGYNYEANTYDTCCGDWNIWGNEGYIGFQKINEDTIIGWMRLEMQAYTDLIILKDCGIQKFSEKRNISK